MGPWTTLLVTYVVGGVTFVPLLVLAVLVHAHYTFPYRYDLQPSAADGDQDAIVQPGDDTAALDEAKRKGPADDAKTRVAPDLDVAAGYFAVCREYTPMGINAKPIERQTPIGSTTVAAPSPSVYQTMYRSIFDRRPVPGPLDNNGSSANNGKSQRPKKAGNVFYVVLRHGHLMLFDDEEQLEVRHVISLALHDVSIYSGGDVTPEGELFIKRNALCLSRRRGKKDAADAQVTKPFYLFSENCSAKEDFYFALLKSQEQTFGFESDPPIPKGFEVKNIIALVQRLHSSEDHIHTRWFNAMLGRVFLAVYRTPDLENFIRQKITKKIGRVKRPSFLTNITIQKIDTGEGPPYFTNLKLKDLTVEGECVVSADVKYTGGCRIEVGATAKIDLGTRFKAREVNMLLAVVLKRLEGQVLFKVKAPPSNRMWMSFQGMPKMEMAIEPIVSSRQITYTVILRQIENRIKEVFAETLVQPFWDDVPFFKTEQKHWRGGIFQESTGTEAEGSGDAPAAAVPDEGDVSEARADDQDMHDDAKPLEKSSTMPVGVVEPAPTPAGFFGRKLGKSANGSSASVLSTGLDASGKGSATTGSSTPRSLGFISNAKDPVVGTETAHADLFKPSTSPPDHATQYMAALASRSQEPSPMHTPYGSPDKGASLNKGSGRSSISSRDASDGQREADASGGVPGEPETTPVPADRRNTASSTESAGRGEGSAPASPSLSATGSSKGHGGPLGRNFFMRRENTGSTIASGDSTTGHDLKKNTLAAVTNAAVQARQWGWNAIQRQKEARRQDKPHSLDLSRPMGRGQPLPPPGTPLPGPANGRSRIVPPAGPPLPKRKPVPDSAGAAATKAANDAARASSDESEKPAPSSNAPPPLPNRRRRGASQHLQDEGEQKMLVVAVPDDDSQPSTPAAEEKKDLGTAWEEAARAETEDNYIVTSTTATPPMEIENQAAGPEDADTESASQSIKHPNMSDESLSDGQPIVALPAAEVADVAEDDDFSGWLDEDALADEPTADVLPAHAVGEVK